MSEPLSPADRSALAAEHGPVNMAVGGLLLFDDGEGMRQERARARRRPPAPRASLSPAAAVQRAGLANPVWVDDDGFDLRLARRDPDSRRALEPCGYYDRRRHLARLAATPVVRAQKLLLDSASRALSPDLLAAVAGMLRSYLAAAGEPLGKPLVALMPVSVRRPGEEGGNRMSNGDPEADGRDRQLRRQRLLRPARRPRPRSSAVGGGRGLGGGARRAAGRRGGVAGCSARRTRNYRDGAPSSQHMRAATACLLVLAVIAVGVAPGAMAKPVKRPATACEKLAKRHKDRSRDRKLVLVVRGDDETGNISACILPRGKVRTLASWDDGLMRDAARIFATAGPWVLVEETHADQYGGTSRSLTRIDVRGGRRLLLSSYGCQLDYSRPVCDSGTNFGEVVMAASGAGALELSDYAARTTSLRGFSPGGTFANFADGPVDTLRLVGGMVVWTQAGVEHIAPLLP